MLPQLIFATQNRNKAIEISALLEGKFDVRSLIDLGYTGEIPETGHTLEDNALIKARHVFKLTGKNCFADDTGLEVDALNGAPGVYSARYAGEQKNDSDNIDLLLQKLRNEPDRKAHFRTVIALIFDGEEYLFEGIVKGEIITEKKGNGGFGYDPVFKPENSEITFAQMLLEEKNQISHRAQAFAQMKNFLMNL
ncbi:MAG: RdgB/HAM1 family non-canonical purine NTP pyrophosphatase [Bacteroidia bacterium]|nr:RdgB/HAM1 family non-canonical purine NTP pyrophosphatase [Bacteroidia bacterium]